MRLETWQSPFFPWLGIPENVFNPAHRGFFTLGNLHLDHIKPPWHLPRSEAPQPFVRPALDERLLLPIHRSQSPHHRVLLASFHFGKQNLLTIPRHNIDLPALPAFEISGQHFAVFRSQPIDRDSLPVFARPFPRARWPTVRAVGRVEISAETTNDDSDKAHDF